MTGVRCQSCRGNFQLHTVFQTNDEKTLFFSIIVSVTSLLAPTVSVIDDVFEGKADGSGTLNLLMISL